jgi:hypothetical protein
MKNIAEMIQLVEDNQLQDKLFAIYEMYEDAMLTLPASLRHNHIYVQGLYDHTQQTMHLALRMFGSLRQMGPLGCTQDDVILVSFLSNIDRVERYTTEMKGELPTFTEKNDYLISPRMRIATIASKFNLILDDKHLNALTFMTSDWREEELEYLGDAIDLYPLAAILRAAKNLSMNCFPYKNSVVEEEL